MPLPRRSSELRLDDVGMVDIDLENIEQEYQRQGLDEHNETFEEWVRNALREHIYSVDSRTEVAARLGDTDKLQKELEHQEKFYRELIEKTKEEPGQKAD